MTPWHAKRSRHLAKTRKLSIRSHINLENASLQTLCYAMFKIWSFGRRRKRTLGGYIHKTDAPKQVKTQQPIRSPYDTPYAASWAGGAWSELKSEHFRWEVWRFSTKSTTRGTGLDRTRGTDGDFAADILEKWAFGNDIYIYIYIYASKKRLSLLGFRASPQPQEVPPLTNLIFL